MPASPKLKASSLPTVNMVRRSSAHIARRFFFGRRGLRRTLILFLALLFIYYLSRGDDNPYNLKKDEDVVDKYPDRDSKATAFRALQEKKQKISPVSRLEPSKDGLIRVGNWVDRRHPLLEIIDRAEREWKKEVDFRPSTLSEAHDRYVERYHSPPPSSYSYFFNLLPPQCPIPSFDSIRLYNPITSSTLRLQQSGLEGSPMTITIVIRNGRVGGGAVDDHDNLFHLRETSRQLTSLLMEISESLPDLRFTLSADYPRNPLSHRLRVDLSDHLRLDEKFDDEDEAYDGQDGGGIYNFHGWSDACAPSDPLIRSVEITENPNNPLNFIYTSNPLSPCHHRSLIKLSDFFAAPSPDFGVVHPVFALLRTAIHGDILLPRPETGHALPGNVAWGKKQSILYWRGPASPGATSDELVVPINRLMTLYNTTGTTLPPHNVLRPTNGDGFEVERNVPVQLGRTRIDLAFTKCGDQLGCSDMHERYPFVAQGTEEAQWSDAKFILDLESRDPTPFRQLLLSGSLVLRASLFEDFWVAQAKPWVHYVPIQPDFSDLATILLFFEAHDHLAKSIALSGQTIARECFGRAGTKAGLMGVLGEYGRMWNDGRYDPGLHPK